MNYYKVISNQTVIDANHVFLRWQRKHRILLGCPAAEAHYIQSSDQKEVWRVPWLNPLPEGAPAYETVEAVEIGEEEYRTLRAQLDEGLSVEAPEEPAAEPETEEEEQTEPGEPAVMSAAEMRRRITDLEARNAFLEECILELSEVMFA